MKHKQRLHPILILLLVASVSGCASLYRFEVDVLEPATVSVSPKMDSIIIVNRTWLPRHDKEMHYIPAGNGKKKQHARFVVAKSATQNLKAVMENSPKYSYMKIIQDTTYSSRKPVNKKYLQSLRGAFGTAGAVILDSLSYSFFAELKRNKPSLSVDASTEVVYKALWTYYDLTSLQQIDKLHIKDTDKWSGEFYNKRAALNALPQRGRVALRTGEILGSKYGLRIAPHWVTAQRYFYAYHPKMLDAQKAAMNNNWEKAAELWRPLTRKGKKIVSEYASFNMAIAAEMMGKPKIALHWAKKAHNMYESETTKKYIDILEKRIEKQRMLDRQLGD